MAIFIKQVEGYNHEEIYEGIECQGCGCGNWKETTERLCRCGKMMQRKTFDFSKWIPGYIVIRCACLETVNCTNFTNTCSCGRDYNFAGTELAPREQWGEETGETRMECY
jgi:hypothetical protein